MKRILLDALISLAAGFAAHQARPRLRRLSTEGWRSLVGYSFGTLVVILTGSLFYHHLPELRDGRRYFVSSLLSAFWVGCGVAAGWLLDGE